MAFLITGTGKRIAKAFEGDEKGATKLFFELEESSVPKPVPKTEVRGPARPYTVRLHFLEPDPDVRPADRKFDVVLQGQTVLRDLDIVAETEGSLARSSRVSPKSRSSID